MKIRKNIFIQPKNLNQQNVKSKYTTEMWLSRNIIKKIKIKY